MISLIQVVHLTARHTILLQVSPIMDNTVYFSYKIREAIFFPSKLSLLDLLLDFHLIPSPVLIKDR